MTSIESKISEMRGYNLVNIIKLLFLSALTLTTFHSYGQKSINVANKNLSYQGRIDLSKDSVSFYWPGSSVTVAFKGTGLKATMKSFRERDYYYAIVDSNQKSMIKISSDSLKKTIVIISGLANVEHKVQLFKLANSTSETRFYGFEILGRGAFLTPVKLPKRKIEFYGNSITAGHGVDAPKGVKNSGAPQYFNNYYTYAALTARHYNAQYSCVARSGIGLMVSWFPEIMPETYDRVDPMKTQKRWDFSKYTPDIVVVNLCQNDYWLVNMHDNPQFRARFGVNPPTEEFIIKSYQDFISTIRLKYPGSSIICALGNMNATETGSKWPNYILKAVANLKDEKIFCQFFPFKNTQDHPNRVEQQSMADQLISFIDQNIKW